MAAGRPPQLTASAVAMTIKKYFDFSEVYEQTCKVLPSWSDRIWYFQGKITEASAGEYVLKIINPEVASHKATEGALEVMKHLFSRHLLVPCPISSRTGRNSLLLSSADLFSLEQGDKDMRYPVYLLSYIPGKLFDSLEKKHLTPALLYEVGELVGKIDKELMVWQLIKHPREEGTNIQEHFTYNYRVDGVNPDSRLILITAIIPED